MRDSRRKLLSQNFLCNRELVRKLIRNSSISQNDSVLEIGAGKGIITMELLGFCKEIVAIETDDSLFSALKSKLAATKRITLIPGNFLHFPLPDLKPFKVFSNIPFSITGGIIKKLLFSQNPPIDSYLVVQKEAADKYIANVHHNTLVAILFYPWFDIKIVHNFQKSDFKPKPGVDTCLIHIEKRGSPLVDESKLLPYRDFISYFFTRDRKATSRQPNGWLSLFNEFMKNKNFKALNKVKGSFDKWRIQEQDLSKIHRTRTDKDWWKLKSDGN